MAQSGSRGRFQAGSVLLNNGVEILTYAGTPVNGTTGAGLSGPGSLCIDSSNKKLYQNTNTKASPTWESIGDIAAAEIALAEGRLLVGNNAGAATAIDAKTTGAILIGNGTTVTSQVMSVDATMASTGVVTISSGVVTSAKLATAVVNMINGLRTYLADGMLQIGTLAVSGVAAEKFKTTTEVIYTIAGLPYTKAITDNLVFAAANAANTVGADGNVTAYWGVWLIEINAAGTVLAKPAAGAPMVYTTEPLAIAALPAVTAGSVQIGYITVQNLTNVGWVATTSNLTAGAGVGNCTARNFYNVPGAKTLPAAL